MIRSKKIILFFSLNFYYSSWLAFYSVIFLLIPAVNIFFYKKFVHCFPFFYHFRVFFYICIIFCLHPDGKCKVLLNLILFQIFKLKYIKFLKIQNNKNVLRRNSKSIKLQKYSIHPLENSILPSFVLFYFRSFPS